MRVDMSKKQAILLNVTKLFSRKGYKDSSTAELAYITGLAGGHSLSIQNRRKPFSFDLEAIYESCIRMLKDGWFQE